MSQDRISVTVLVGTEILACVSADEWRALSQRMDDVPYFMQFEMVTGYLKYLRASFRDPGADAREPLVLQLKRGGKVVGMLLLEHDSVSVSGLRLPALSLVAHPHAPQSDVLLAREESLASFMPAIVAALSERGIRWEVLRLPALRDSSASWVESTHSALKPRVMSRLVGHADYFDCTKGYASLEAKYRTSLKRRIGQALRQLSRMGEIEYSCVLGGLPESAQAFGKFLDLEGAGWKGSQGTAIAQSERLRAHYEELYALDAPQAWSEVHLMTLDGKVIAAQFCVVSGGIREVVKLAYDESLRKQSPGNVMLDHMLLISCEDERTNTFGLVGRPPWLAEWAPSSHEVHDIWLFRRRAIARLGILSTRLKRSTVQFLEERVRRTGNQGVQNSDASAGSMDEGVAQPPSEVKAAPSPVPAAASGNPHRAKRKRTNWPAAGEEDLEPVSRLADLDGSRASIN
jgi:CelD/BcsL family acetyltransferase involved in cellulose biosynthesis